MKCPTVGALVRISDRVTSLDVDEFVVNGRDIRSVVLSSLDAALARFGAYLDRYAITIDVYVNGGCNLCIGDALNVLRSATNWFGSMAVYVTELKLVVNVRRVDSHMDTALASVSTDYRLYRESSFSLEVKDACGYDLGGSVGINMNVGGSDIMRVEARWGSGDSDRVRISVTIDALLNVDEFRRFVPWLIDSLRGITEYVRSIATTIAGTVHTDGILMIVHGSREGSTTRLGGLYRIVESMVDGLRTIHGNFDRSVRHIRYVHALYLSTTRLLYLFTGYLPPRRCDISLNYRSANVNVWYICDNEVEPQTHGVHVWNRTIGRLRIRISTMVDLGAQPGGREEAWYLFHTTLQLDDELIHAEMVYDKYTDRYVFKAIVERQSRKYARILEHEVVDPLGSPGHTLLTVLRGIANAVAWELPSGFIINHLGN